MPTNFYIFIISVSIIYICELENQPITKFLYQAKSGGGGRHQVIVKNVDQKNKWIIEDHVSGINQCQCFSWITGFDLMDMNWGTDCASLCLYH